MVKVFITGATGFVGSRVVKALLADGHQIFALSRRTGSQLEGLSVSAVQGSLEDIDIVTAAAKAADATLHIGFDHDFSRYVESSAQDKAIVTAVSKAYTGTGKLFAMTSAIALCGDTGAELAADDRTAFGPRAASESAILQVTTLHCCITRQWCCLLISSTPILAFTGANPFVALPGQRPRRSSWLCIGSAWYRMQ